MKNSKDWTNRNGVSIPSKYVPALERKKTELVEKQLKKAIKLQKLMTEFKTELIEDCDKMFDAMKLDANVRTGEKGNYTLSTFDGKNKVEVSVQNRIEFDENINFAQEKFNEFLKEKSDGLDQDVSTIVNHAFTSSRGSLDTKRVLNLFSYNITHKLWLEGIELLKKAIKTKASKRYARIFTTDTEGASVVVELNFSNL